MGRQALLSLALKDRDAALSFFQLAAEDREAEMVWLGGDPRFDPIRRREVFAEIAGKVNPSGPLRMQ